MAAGTQHGHVERLRGLGVPHLRGRGRGDLFVHVVVEIPTTVSAEEDVLLRHYAALRGEQVTPPGGGGGEGVFSRLRSAFGYAESAQAPLRRRGSVRAAAAAQVFVDDPSRAVLSDEDLHHLGRVLRLRDGEEVVAGDGRGPVGPDGLAGRPRARNRTGARREWAATARCSTRRATAGAHGGVRAGEG